ncbi:transposase (fragment) [Nostocoides japonicum T1-X7]|uniref:Transposase n=1 Tax=Nostocoides japonicum T1-X7 TaxID=1194083 RepID=A0A077M054_9MICO
MPGSWWVLDVHSDRSEPAVPAPVSSLIPVADALTAGDVRPGQDVPVAVWQVLSTVEDPRRRRGRRHRLATVLVVALAAVLAGQRSLAGIAEWAADLPRWARPRLGVRPELHRSSGSSSR